MREIFRLCTLLGLACSPAPVDQATCADMPLDCAPLYEPNFTEVFSRTLRPTCAAAGAACHAAAGAQGGLVFEDEADAYARLTRGPRPKVIAGDARCSEIVHRVTSRAPEVVMPPARPLSAAEQCSIIKWVAAGAKP